MMRNLIEMFRGRIGRSNESLNLLDNPDELKRITEIWAAAAKADREREFEEFLTARGVEFNPVHRADTTSA